VIASPALPGTSYLVTLLRKAGAWGQPRWCGASSRRERLGACETAARATCVQPNLHALLV